MNARKKPGKSATKPAKKRPTRPKLTPIIDPPGMKNGAKKAQKPARSATKPAQESKPAAKKPPGKPDDLRGWLWAAAAACQEAADAGEDGYSHEAYIAECYLKRVEGKFPRPKKSTFQTLAQSIWGVLGQEDGLIGIEGESYQLSPYRLSIVQDEQHFLYDVRGHETTDPNPKEFAALVEGVAAVGFVMQAVLFTVERGVPLVADGRRRERAARAVNMRRLSAASVRADDPRAAPPTLIETIPAICVMDRRRLIEIKNGSNYHRCSEDALRQAAGIQQLEAHMQQVQIAALLGVTTQTVANQRSLANLTQTAREALRSNKITLTLAYRLARELPERQDGALEATKALPAKARQRAVEAWLAGDSPEAEARALRARDVRTLNLKVQQNQDPELAPLRALFALLRGNEAAAADLPPKWRDCLGLPGIPAATAEAVAPPRSTAQAKRQTEIDDGVPSGMRVRCPQCGAEPTEYCLGDGPDEDEQWGHEDGTRIHQTRIIASRRSRMPDLPPIEQTEASAPAGRGRKGDKGQKRGREQRERLAGSPWSLLRHNKDVEELQADGIEPEECALTSHREITELCGEAEAMTTIAELLNQGYLAVRDVVEWVHKMREDALGVGCPVCDAEAGQSCVGHSDSRERPHVERMKLAEKANMERITMLTPETGEAAA